MSCHIGKHITMGFWRIKFSQKVFRYKKRNYTKWNWTKFHSTRFDLICFWWWRHSLGNNKCILKILRNLLALLQHFWPLFFPFFFLKILSTLVNLRRSSSKSSAKTPEVRGRPLDIQGRGARKIQLQEIIYFTSKRSENIFSHSRDAKIFFSHFL